MLVLATGTAVVPTADGFLVHTPEEEILHLEPAREHLPTVGALLRGHITLPQAREAAPDAGWDDLLAALRDASVLRAAAPLALLVGEHRGLIQRMRSVLAGAGVETAVVDALPAVAGHLPRAVVVGVARWLPDSRWRRLDAWAADQGLPSHRLHAEGRRWYVGPFWVPAADGQHPRAGYEDLRIRRLAASPCPDDLQRLWAWLDSAHQPAGADDLSAPCVEDAARLIATDVTAWFTGRPAPGEDTQVGLDPESGAQRRHPVLAVPRNLLRDAS